jgi:serine/threonine protein kinase
MATDHHERRCELRVGQILETASEDWRVMSLIGSGETGAVFEVEVAGMRALGMECKSTGQSRTYAAKVPHREFWPSVGHVPRLYGTLQMIDHPNVVQMRGLLWTTTVTNESVPLIVMERLRGHTLRELMLGSTSPFTPSLIASVACDVLTGLDEIHSRGLVHGDVRPEHVFIDHAGRRSGRAVLLDVGEGALRSRASRRSAAANLYLAPEQVRGDEATRRSDLYSFGAVLYEMFAKAPMFLGLVDEDLNDAHERRLPTPLREVAADVPPALEGVIMAALAKDPRRRPGDAHTFAEPFRAAVVAATRAAGQSALGRVLGGVSLSRRS